MNNADLNATYILNPLYRLKKDKNRVFLISRYVDPALETYFGLIHPVYAVMLSFFDGKLPLKGVLDGIGKVLRKDRETLLKILSPLIENTEERSFTYDGYKFHLPINVLVRWTGDSQDFAYDPEIFFIPKNELDMESWRLHSPLDAIFVIHTRCVTDCIYCYADRKKISDCRIPLERIKEIIREARELGMRTLDITGGEFLLYPGWEEVLAELHCAGFLPYLSTKCPLDTETILKLKKVGVKRIQISIDSLEKDEITRILGVTGDYYLPKLINTLKQLDENGFEIYTNTQLQSINQDKILGLIDFLLTLKNIKRIAVGAAGFSLYKGIEYYKTYKPNLAKVKEIESRIKELKTAYNGKVSLNFSGYSDKDSLLGKTIEEKKTGFSKRARCTANFSGFIILPDGQVTICEELYWHPRFIIGDLKKQSITEVWNSDKALELYNISKDMIREESQCKKCDEFDACRKYKGVCWKEILYAYGEKNWDYPDPKCPYAPAPFIEYYLSSIAETRN